VRPRQFKMPVKSSAKSERAEDEQQQSQPETERYAHLSRPGQREIQADLLYD
jgi:hypothetical protein